MKLKQSLHYLALLGALSVAACSQSAPGVGTAASAAAQTASTVAGGAASAAAAASATSVSASSTSEAVAAMPEAAIRKNLAERLPQMPAIQEVRPTPVAGLYEVRIGNTDILYADSQGDFLFQGVLVDTKNRKNLTEERLHALNSIDFKTLPLQDAMVSKKGNGSRELAVFADPNCGYCKRFEAELEKVNNVTIYTFLYPILGPDSTAKSQHIWCAKNRDKVWHDWMVNNVPPPEAQCDAEVINRNLAFGQQHKINGTPAIILENGQRLAGAVEAQALEEMLTAAKTQP